MPGEEKKKGVGSRFLPLQTGGGGGGGGGGGSRFLPLQTGGGGGITVSSSADRWVRT